MLLTAISSVPRMAPSTQEVLRKFLLGEKGLTQEGGISAENQVFSTYRAGLVGGHRSENRNPTKRVGPEGHKKQPGRDPPRAALYQLLAQEALVKTTHIFLLKPLPST